MINHTDEVALNQSADYKDQQTAFEQTITLFEYYFGFSMLGDGRHQPAACGRPGNSSKM